MPLDQTPAHQPGSISAQLLASIAANEAAARRRLNIDAASHGFAGIFSEDAKAPTTTRSTQVAVSADELRTWCRPEVIAVADKLAALPAQSVDLLVQAEVAVILAAVAGMLAKNPLSGLRTDVEYMVLGISDDVAGRSQ